jgi:hypothetical protein
MQSLSVIETLDVIKDGRPGRLPIHKIAVMHQFVLQVREETLRYGIVAD